MPWQDLEERLAPLLVRLREIRHDLHRHPELGFEERRTQQVVAAWLTEHGYEPQSSAQTGLLCDLHPGRDPVLALRADLDALPIQEETDLPYRSVHQGVAHKCGHDGHTCILMGVAALLALLRQELQGNVRLLFQPAEEGVRGGGARAMLAEGALDNVPEVYGLHNWPGFPKGDLRVKAGPVLAQVDNFQLLITGVGGHASQPQVCRDPILAGAQMVTALQSVVSRGLSATDAAVLSVGSFVAGQANNVIPAEARLLGTIRCFHEHVRTKVHERLSEVVSGIAAGMGVKAELEIKAEYPVLKNDAGCTETVQRVGRKLFGEARVSAAGLPLSVSEDFAFLSQAVPGAYFFLGAGTPGETIPTCHHPDYDFDDDLLEAGIRMLLGISRDRLEAWQP